MKNQVEKDFNVAFTDRMLFTYRNKNEEISIVSRKDFERLAAEAIINDETIVFNNLVGTKSELESGWKIPFAESWHKKLVLA